MATKRQYPRVPNIMDNDIRESLKMSWDKMYDHVDQIGDLSLRLAAAEGAINTLKEQVAKLQQQIVQASSKADES